MSNDRTVKNLTSAKRFLLAVSGIGTVALAISREMDVVQDKANGRLTVTDGDASFVLHYGDKATETRIQIIQEYCERHSLSAQFLDFPRPSKDSSKGDLSPTGWEPAREDDGTEKDPAGWLEFEVAGGVRIKKDGAIRKVLNGGVEMAHVSAFAISETKLGAWGNVTGSPLFAALNESKKEAAETDKARLLEKLALGREARVNDCRKLMEKQGLTADDLQGLFSPDEIAEAMPVQPIEATG